MEKKKYTIIYGIENLTMQEIIEAPNHAVAELWAYEAAKEIFEENRETTGALSALAICSKYDLNSSAKDFKDAISIYNKRRELYLIYKAKEYENSI